MKREAIELIVLKLTSNGEDAINMKIYKNGTTCRQGAGGLPQLGIGMMSFVDDSRFFDPLVQAMPDEVLGQLPIMKVEDETPNGYLEYVLAFYGESKNGETGERADWAQSTGIRIRLDGKSEFNHPIMKLLDWVITKAAELTNEIYFDVIMKAQWDSKSDTLPEQTIITQPKTKDEIQRDYENYVNQMLQNPRGWKMSDFVKDKTYTKGGLPFTASITESTGGFSIRFTPGFGHVESEHSPTQEPGAKKPKKKPWWRF